MKKVEHVPQSLPNFEQDSSKNAKTILDEKKKLKLEAQIANIAIEIDDLEASLLIFVAAKAAMTKIDSDKNDPFTKKDIESEIKLINRKIHYYRYLKFK